MKDVLMSMIPWGRSSVDRRVLEESQAKVIQLTERMRKTADELEEQVSAHSASPHVGLYEPVVVDTGHGFVEAVLVNLNVSSGPDGRCVLDGRLVDRRQYAQMLRPAAI